MKRSRRIVLVLSSAVVGMATLHPLPVAAASATWGIVQGTAHNSPGLSSTVTSQFWDFGLTKNGNGIVGGHAVGVTAATCTVSLEGRGDIASEFGLASRRCSGTTVASAGETGTAVSGVYTEECRGLVYQRVLLTVEVSGWCEVWVRPYGGAPIHGAGDFEATYSLTPASAAPVAHYAVDGIEAIAGT